MEDGSSLRTEGLGRIAAELLHDLAADLETLRGWSGIVLEGARINHVTPADALTMHIETERVGRLVSELVGWVTRPDPRQRLQPAVQLAQTVERARHREGVIPIVLDLQVPPEVEIAGPASFFDRIAANLIRNSLRHGDRLVSVSLTPHLERGQPGVVLRVEDDGTGVPRELRQRLFTPFAHGSPAGHGLGLSSTAWLTAQLGGTPPRYGAGTLGGACFEIWLPTAVPLKRARAASLPEHVTVAVLDDDPSVRRVVSRFLEHAGAHVLQLEPGPRIAEQLLEGELEPDLLILDRNLGGLDGYQLWWELRARRPQLARRTALLTGGLRPSDAPEELVTLQKPTSREALLEWVRQAVR